jgi:hypothetical protein
MSEEAVAELVRIPDAIEEIRVIVRQSAAVN